MGDILMTRQLSYDYYEWLISQIQVGGSRTYRDLYERLHNVEFVWTVPNDDNRLADGQELRIEFLNECTDISSKQITKFYRSVQEGATFLEVVIALSRRLEFNAGEMSAPAWAWKLLKNIGLNKMSDPFDDEKARKVDEIVERVIWRQYDRNGKGGFFPLKFADKDQTKVEIWYQMHAYIIERDKL